MQLFHCVLLHDCRQLLGSRAGAGTAPMRPAGPKRESRSGCQ